MSKESKASLLSLWLVFVVFLFFYGTRSMTLWVALDLWSVGISVFLLVRNGLPTLGRIGISAVLTLLVVVSYLGYAPGFSPAMVLTGLPTLVGGLAVLSVMEKHGGLHFVRRGEPGALGKSLLIGIGVGVVLGVLNYFLGKNSSPLDVSLNFSRILVSLNPAIHEEIACRAVFLAFFVYTFRDRVPSRFAVFTLWFMMSVPHTLSHGYDPVMSAVLLVLFGLPFTFLQRKRDLLSAMVGHGLVDAIRFVIFGLPA